MMKTSLSSAPLRLVAAAIALAVAGAAAAQGAAAPAAAPDTAPAPCAVPDCRAGAMDGHGPRHGHQMRGDHRQAMMLCALDADRDGQVGRNELLAAQQRQLERFDKADADGDGRLSRQEFSAAKRGLRDEIPPHCGPGRRGPGGPAGPAPSPAQPSARGG